MCEEVADNVTGHLVPDAGHWVAEENPGYLCRMFIEFDSSARTAQLSRPNSDSGNQNGHETVASSDPGRNQ
jgi:hypothetical protein